MVIAGRRWGYWACAAGVGMCLGFGAVTQAEAQSMTPCAIFASSKGWLRRDQHAASLEDIRTLIRYMRAQRSDNEEQFRRAAAGLKLPLGPLLNALGVPMPPEAMSGMNVSADAEHEKWRVHKLLTDTVDYTDDAHWQRVKTQEVSVRPDTAVSRAFLAACSEQEDVISAAVVSATGQDVVISVWYKFPARTIRGLEIVATISPGAGMFCWRITKIPRALLTARPGPLDAVFRQGARDTPFAYTFSCPRPFSPDAEFRTIGIGSNAKAAAVSVIELPPTAPPVVAARPLQVDTVWRDDARLVFEFGREPVYNRHYLPSSSWIASVDSIDPPRQRAYLAICERRLIGYNTACTAAIAKSFVALTLKAASTPLPIRDGVFVAYLNELNGQAAVVIIQERILVVRQEAMPGPGGLP